MKSPRFTCRCHGTKSQEKEREAGRMQSQDVFGIRIPTGVIVKAMVRHKED